MYTGYWITANYIHGPIMSGEFYITSDGYIHGPKNSGLYYIGKNKHIWGPRYTGEFWLSGIYINGPNENLPWLD